MRFALRSPIAIAVALCLTLAVPAMAQSPELPRALAPDGRAPLEGTSWRLTTYLQPDGERSVEPEVAAWLELRGGRLTGSGGCTKLRGRYAVSGSALSVALGRIKDSACGRQTTIVQEALVAGLEAAAAYRLADGDEGASELVVSDAAGVGRLRFAPDDAASLEGNEWLLEAFEVDGERSEADSLQPAVLSFQPRRDRAARRHTEGELVGSTGCNGVVAGYSRQADMLSLGDLQPTDAPCSGRVAAQEDAIMRVLGASAIALDLPPDRLTLVAVDGDARLELVSATPLEDTTWTLERLGKAAARTAEPVTLRFEDGIATVVSPCGPYVGDYVTDGVFITISAVVQAGDTGCRTSSLERRLMTVLRETVRVDRGRGDLRLEDAAGTVRARFATIGPP